MTKNENLRAIVITGLVAFSVLAIGVGPVQAQETGNDATATAADAANCDGSPTMARTSITSPQNIITADNAGLIEANFRVSENVPEDCTVVVDLQYSFAQSGFQFEGGSAWDQSATDILATEFTLASGEIRSIDAEIAANGANVGDDVTVVADYEIWYQGDREDSRQISGVRQDFEVQEPGSTTETGGDGPGIIEAIAENLVTVLAVVSIGLIGLVLAWKGRDIIAFSS
ncbi:hypothetical protein NDI56_16220 [Haloarcula sp. S1CR25-12]|uniref:PGF-CTERM sorting domain-containing protein n=1 Tax=Haloarcula saliterrae TaxID=2950534 RepID=A0ABU2FFB6_9EURY|nr:hypothetical protein [Haloarcula sp. S1CR25-12]MDS0260948.1 hypothetical protein [Haloarcula sp. S1CR25-12]